MSIENKTRAKRMKQKPISIHYKGEILYGIHPVYLALLAKKRQLFHSWSNSPKWQDLECAVNGAMSSHLPLWLVLSEVVDPMNVGAIIRSAKYFGVNKLFVMKGSSCKLSPTVSKASSGALEVMNIYQVEKLETLLQVKKSEGWNIVSTVAYCEEECKISKEIRDVSDFSISKPTILILGNEGKGIPFEIQMLCDSFVSIYPTENLHPGFDSLNVSVAAGVILYSISSKIKSHH
ncbi:rRNA methyltransferase 1, mitochondrial [Nephila pilipes]|uniref:rRNA methyltransferase 1, mitochondrial n=1 Tax=Nephila pilipes TaxID=299642 RepID=A0A8X6KL04_NEPPI|nr:rRNA methyltransferase 1, mitochondrial [Nephila pilipes]